MAKTVYVAGRMTFEPENGKAAFDRAAAKLRADGHVVINPSELNSMFGKGRSYAQCLKADLALILSVCDAVYLLSNYTKSRGARVEKAVAEAIGLEVWFEDEDAS